MIELTIEKNFIWKNNEFWKYRHFGIGFKIFATWGFKMMNDAVSPGETLIFTLKMS